jgi:hypothetical protein
MTKPPNIVRFPLRPKPREVIDMHRVSCAKLLDQLRRLNDGLEAGMTAAEIQHEWEARECEAVIRHWAKRLAAHPRRGPAAAASFLCSLGGNLNGETES